MEVKKNLSDTLGIRHDPVVIEEPKQEIVPYEPP